MQNTEISRHPKSTKLSLYVSSTGPNSVPLFLLFMLKTSTTVAVRDQQTEIWLYLTESEIFPIRYNMQYIALIIFVHYNKEHITISQIGKNTIVL